MFVYDIEVYYIRGGDGNLYCWLSNPKSFGGSRELTAFTGNWYSDWSPSDKSGLIRYLFWDNKTITEVTEMKIEEIAELIQKSMPDEGKY